ncbi:hypothetical protein OQ279_00335 [Salinimicrobium sp. MT39]|jgi:hypothetical protein|uniref:Uncharacterized protein n=1 Tax=Salinimicrobium profundisediminis TaxID=2994553 RepID=A0A9X3CTL3_9FLAO|nr:hypothetical protein [Salinimicrobium profundisediminis]MCX2836582.1 hypothetical protein [Salinimicrobium profundisediminis]
MKKNGLPYHNTSGFKVPEGYFQDFEARMMSRVTEDEKSFGDNPFKVPNDYFEHLGDRVFEKIETPKEGKVIPLFNRKIWSYVASVAAVVAILFSTVIFNDNSEVGFEDLNITAVENYLLESIDTDNPNETDFAPYEITASANPNIDKEALYEYLNENIEEPALLLNEN